MSKATAGTTKINAFWCMFARRPTTCVSNHCNYGIRIFLWWFYGKFSMILSDFCMHGVRKATPVTTKANAFWCNFAGRSTACVFEHCTIGIYVFSCSFRGDLWCILASFCMILSSRLEAWSRYMNGPRSNSKRVIFITFWSVFCVGKIELPVTFGGFSEK